MAIAYEISREGKKERKNEIYSDARSHEITIYSGKRKKRWEARCTKRARVFLKKLREERRHLTRETFFNLLQHGRDSRLYLNIYIYIHIYNTYIRFQKI